MKLFQRTLLSFAGVIALQALFTGAALTSILDTNQASDASREIASEASAAFESFNAWKLAFWKEVNEIAEDGGVRAAVASSKLSPATDPGVERALARRLSGSTASAALVRDPDTGMARYVKEGPEGLPIPEAFYFKRSHPYVEILSSMEGLWFAGASRVSVASAGLRPATLEVYLLKRIDSTLLAQLSYDPMVVVAVSVPGSGMSVSGSHPSGSRSAFASAASALEYARLLSPREGDDRAYIAYPPALFRGLSYSAVVQKTGTVASAGGERPVLLSAVLSLDEYTARSARLQRGIMAVTLVVAVLTIIVALLLSRSIVSPVRRLSSAMMRIEAGDYGVELRGPSSGEIGELLAGFNAMARKIEADKLEIEARLGEIVFLKERADAIIESIREGLAVVDAEGRIELANEAFLQLFGSASVPGSPLSGIEGGPFDSSFLEIVSDALRDGTRRGGIKRRVPDGRSFEIKVYPLAAALGPGAARAIVVAEDASERLAYEERAIQSDRLASVGLFAAGIAHEINNPLSSILANVGNAIVECGEGEAASSLRVVESETLRIARIVRQLMDFASPSSSAARRGDLAGAGRCDVNAVARELVRLVGYPFRGEGRVVFIEELDPSIPEASISEDELKQVLLNLIKNALHAIGETGTIGLCTSATADGVEVAVSDDGPGIPEAIMGRIFDPFFSTRTEEGEMGLGLGLSVVYGIVTKRGGSIRAANGPGGGGLFTVSLRAAEEAVRA